MKNTKIETTFRGRALGSSINPNWKMTRIAVDHIDNHSDRAMMFNGVWIPSSLISALIWVDGGGAPVVAEIEIPVWFAIKEQL